MRCKHCGAESVSTETYCRKCGKPLEEEKLPKAELEDTRVYTPGEVLAAAKEKKTLGGSMVRISYRKIMLLGGFVLAAILLLALLLPRIIERYQKAPEASANTRKELAQAAWAMMKDFPLTGVGLNNWGKNINLAQYGVYRGRTEDLLEDEYQDGIVETVYLLTQN